MPDADDLNEIFILIDAINDAVRPENDFANPRVTVFRHDAAKFRMLK